MWYCFAMPEKMPQTYANHTRFDPLFHFFTIPVFAINLLLMLVQVFKYPRLLHGWFVILSAAALVAAFKIRVYALKAQDRVIRLEERLRLHTLLTEPLRSRIADLTPGQLIALRFASDAEIPGLVEKALAGGLKAGDVKKLIVTWRPDYFRI